MGNAGRVQSGKTWFAALLALWLPVQAPCSSALTSLAHEDDATHGVSLAWDHGHLHAVLDHIDHGGAASHADVAHSDGVAFGHHHHDSHVYHLGMADPAVRIDSNDHILERPSPAVLAFAVPFASVARRSVRAGNEHLERASPSLASLRTTILLV